MNAHRLFCSVFFSSIVGLSSCGGGGITSSPSTRTPSISSISPTSATAGGPAFTLTVNGSNFNADAIGFWANPSSTNTPPPSTFVSPTQLTIQVSAADIASPATVQVSVLNPGFPVLHSNTVNFVINPSPAGVSQTISIGANGATPNGSSFDPVLSSTGRFVAFASAATNLVTPNTQFSEGYVRDTCLGVNGCTSSTQLSSAITGGSSEGNAHGSAPSMGNGRFVGFLSTAANLVTPNTKTQQAYVRDTCADSQPCTPITVLASVRQNGGEPNGQATGFIIAIGSCNAAFVSSGTDVVSGVAPPSEVYLSSCSANGPAGGFTTSANLVSADNAGNPGNNQGAAKQPAISFDGRFVAFTSNQTNLPGAPGGGALQVYLRDTCTGQATNCAPSTKLVSVDNLDNPLTGNSQLPAISDDGRFVVFRTDMPLTVGVKGVVNLHDTCNSSSGPVANCTPSTTTVSVAANGTAANGPSNSTQHAVSGDGRFVIFDSSAANLLANGSTSGNQVFVHDTCKSPTGSVSGCTPNTVLVSVDSKGNSTGGFNAAISDDGHFAVFENGTTIIQILFAATGF